MDDYINPFEERKIQTQVEDTRQTLYFAFYINVGGKSAQKAKEIVAEIASIYKPDPKGQYREKFFFFPVTNGDTRIELLGPNLLPANGKL